MKRSIIRTALALCLALVCLPLWGSGAQAAQTRDNGHTQWTLENVWIGGVQVTSLNQDDLTSAIRDEGGQASGSASYDPETHTLYLDSFSYSGAGYTTNLYARNGYYYNFQSGIYTKGDLSIVLAGDNSITMQVENAETFLSGILCEGNLMIHDGQESSGPEASSEGNATLTVTSGTTKSGNGANIYDSMGIRVESVGEINGGKSLYLAHGVTVTAQGGDDGASYYYTSRSAGVSAGTVEVGHGCVLRAASGETDNETCVGIGGNVMVDKSGVLIAQGGRIAIEGTLYIQGEESTWISGEKDGSNAVENTLKPGVEHSFSRNDASVFRYIAVGTAGGGSGSDPGNDPGNDPGGNPGGDSGSNPGNDPGGDPGNDPGDESPHDQEPVITAFNITGAGSNDIMNLNTSGTYETRDDLFEKVEFSSYMALAKYRYMGAGYAVFGDVTPLYLRKTGGATTHEMMLYSHQRLDPAMLHITNGVNHWEAFEGGHFGSGEGEIFWYRTVVEIPDNTSNFIVVMYRQQVMVTWQAFRVYGFNNSTIYPTQIYPVGYVEDNAGAITDFTIQVAGMNLPSDADAYSMTDCTVTAFSGPDAVGKYTLTFHNDTRRDLVWEPLYIYGKERYYFQDTCLGGTDDFGNEYEDNQVNHSTWGVAAEMPTPYYSIFLGGTLEEESAPVIVASAEKSESGTNIGRYSAIAVYRPGAVISCAFYDAAGKMISCEYREAGEDLVFTAERTDAVQAKILILNGDLTPYQNAKSVSLPLPMPVAEPESAPENAVAYGNGVLAA